MVNVISPPQLITPIVMNKISLFYILFAFIFLSSCNYNQYINYNERDRASTSGFEIEELTNLNKSIKVGDIITNNPLCSQIIDSKDDRELYLLLDMGQIYVFDWVSGLLIDSISLKKCGKLQNYSGFTWISSDSILVYNYSRKTLYAIDSKGNIWLKKNSPGITKKDSILFDAESLNASRPLYVNGRIVLSGSVFGNIQQTPDHKERASVSISLSAPLSVYTIPFPDIYYKANWGGVYMNRVHHCEYGDYVLYSFPIEHHVYVYNYNFSQWDTIYMGSRYIESIHSCESSSINTIFDKEYRIKYYVSQASYGPILYDKYRNVFIRIAYHPIENWDNSDYFYQPFSIIVYNPISKEIKESSIIQDSQSYDLENMHICRDGLAIRKQTSDENIIDFICIKL